MQPDKIPGEMKLYPNWVNWRFENRGSSKLAKIPYCPTTKKMADPTDPKMWGSYDRAIENLNFFDGVGFVLSTNDPFCFIDLDETTNIEHLKYQQWIVEKFANTYSERSPSGKGLHIICKASVPTGRRSAFAEIYSHNRFMTMTGEVYSDCPIQEYQLEVSKLWDSFPTKIIIGNVGVNADEIYSDREIYDKATNAENGTKFQALWNGDIQTYHAGDHSSADFAIIDILSFYTQNREQIKRLFRMSGLGRRNKAFREDYVNTMISKSFDRVISNVDLAGYANAINAIIADKVASTELAIKKLENEHIAAIVKVPKPPDEEDLDLEKIDEYESIISPPPGLTGEIAKFIYDQSYKPVKEISITAAIGLMSGVCGRGWNVSGTGLNLYLLLLAGTGRGKEEMSKGIEKLSKVICSVFPAFGDFIGPSDLASGQGLLRYMADHPTKSFVSVFGEFGIKLKSISSQKAFQPDQMLQRVLLDFFSKSGASGIVQPSAYSDAQRNTKIIESPAFSMIGETSPAWFYDNIDNEMISTGLLPRFLVVDYTGPRPPSNEHGQDVIPSADLIYKLSTVGTAAMSFIKAGKPQKIELDRDAKDLSKILDLEADKKINNTRGQNVIVELWNRAHLKTLKLAGLLAVGENPYQPIITRELFEWSEKFVKMTVNTMTDKFSKGMVGSNADEGTQTSYLKSIIVSYFAKDFSTLQGSGTTPEMFYQRIIPYAYISKRTIGNKNFKNDYAGPTVALKRAIQSLKDNGDIIEIPLHQMQGVFKFNGRGFTIQSPEMIAAINPVIPSR